MAAPSLSREPVRVGLGLTRKHPIHSYGWVLVLIIVSFLFAATAPDGAWASSILVLIQSATFVAALWTSGLTRADSPVSALIVVVAVATAVSGLIWGGSTLAGITGIVSFVLTACIAVVIALSVVRQRRVDAQSIRGAICIYILLGMFFLFVYGAVAALDSGAFFAQGTDASRSTRLYFSYVTLATLGYGDYTPAGRLGHTLAITEALMGQLYLVTVVSLLVARVGPLRRDDT